MIGIFLFIIAKQEMRISQKENMISHLKLILSLPPPESLSIYCVRCNWLNKRTIVVVKDTIPLIFPFKPIIN